jgi:hypothetical protein
MATWTAPDGTTKNITFNFGREPFDMDGDQVLLKFLENEARALARQVWRHFKKGAG